MSAAFPARDVPRLIAISPGTHGPSKDLRPWLRALGAAGLPALILRELHLDAESYRQLAYEAAELIPTVIVHSGAPQATKLAFTDAFGLHLPGGGIPTAVRERVDGLLGRSCHSAEEVDDALADGADYTLLSPVWKPVSKTDDTRRSLGPKRFLSIARNRPILALGGITPVRAALLRQGGAHGVAALGSIFAAGSPDAAAETVSALLEAVGAEAEV